MGIEVVFPDCTGRCVKAGTSKIPVSNTCSPQSSCVNDLYKQEVVQSCLIPDLKTYPLPQHDLYLTLEDWPDVVTATFKFKGWNNKAEADEKRCGFETIKVRMTSNVYLKKVLQVIDFSGDYYKNIES